MNVQTGREVRLGLIALALSGLLWTVGIVLRGPADLTDPGSCCRAEFSPAMYVASTVIAVAMLPLYGFFGLYRYLSYRHDNRIAFLAFVISVAATALFFSLTTFLAVSGPAIAELFQQGNRGAIAVAEANFTSPLDRSWLVVRGSAWIIGPILFAVAIWRREATQVEGSGVCTELSPADSGHLPYRIAGRRASLH
jgi:hypothetical protein